MKRLLNSKLFIFILGGIIFGSITGVVAYTINAKDVTYTPKDNNWNVKNVEEAINDLYLKDKNILTNKLTDVALGGTIKLENNTHKIIYAVIFSYTEGFNPATIINNRTKIESIDGANSEELFYSYNDTTNYGIRLYKLTNCENTINIVTNTTSELGEVLLF